MREREKKVRRYEVGNRRDRRVERVKVVESRKKSYRRKKRNK